MSIFNLYPPITELPFLAFDDTYMEQECLTVIVPDEFVLTGSWKAVITCQMATSISGNVTFEVVTDKFPTIRGQTNALVPGEGKGLGKIEISLPNMEVASGVNYLRFCLARIAHDLADTACGDCKVFKIELQAT